MGRALPSLKKIRGGIRAKEIGAGFEDLFEKFCQQQGVAITSIPDGCKQIGPNPRRDLIRVKTPWDWVATYRGQTALLDTKTVEGKSFPCSLITDHQVQALIEHERKGGLGGYVIWLRSTGAVFFIRAQTLFELSLVPGSFCETHPDAIFLGSGYDFDIRRIFSDGLTKAPEIAHDLLIHP